MMLPCKECAYRDSIPGTHHTRCVFAWLPAHPAECLEVIEGARLTERTQQWFRFPFNFDPVWGPDTCPMRAETRDPAQVTPPNPLADILSLLR